ncbi:MAG TPA: DUF1460 domain-containing protein [Prolixibacteraceae bacterium]|nr:DUF1460 domain-containing protein [Prolixibacteraceae bacterium]
MKRAIFVLLLLITCLSKISVSQISTDSILYKPEDKKIVEEKLQLFSKNAALPINELIVEIGKSFLGTPYVSATLENGAEEKLVINLRELDCTTFVENVLALSRAVKSGKSDFYSFVSELQRIRYRNGIRNGYPSRLHYFSEWIRDNQKKGIVDGSPNKNGQKIDKLINFMSKHPADYPVLKAHPELIPLISRQESELSKYDFWYFPKSDFVNLYKNLKHGDIIALTSTIDGVDINHVGIIIKKGTEFYLLHAPLSGKKVLISDGPITDFLKPASKNSGIMIARPIF